MACCRRTCVSCTASRRTGVASYPIQHLTLRQQPSDRRCRTPSTARHSRCGRSCRPVVPCRYAISCRSRLLLPTLRIYERHPILVLAETPNTNPECTSRWTDHKIMPRRKATTCPDYIWSFGFPSNSTCKFRCERGLRSTWSRSIGRE